MWYQYSKEILIDVPRWNQFKHGFTLTECSKICCSTSIGSSGGDPWKRRSLSDPANQSNKVLDLLLNSSDCKKWLQFTTLPLINIK